MLLPVGLLLVLAASEISSQLPTMYGRTFAVTFPPRRASSPRGEEQCRLYINAYTTSIVNIQTLNGATTRQVNAGETYIYENVNCENQVSENGLEDKAVYVTSDELISLMLMSNDGTLTGFNNFDTSLIYPIDYLDGNTTEYYIYNYNKDTPDGTTNSCGNSTDIANFYVIVASEDNTTVTLSFPPDYNQETTIKLNRFQTFLVSNLLDDRLSDYTGTYITSDRPITVLAGSLCVDATIQTTDPEGVAWSAMVPVSAWTAGEYISYEIYSVRIQAPDFEPQDDFYELVIMASQADTVVNIAGANRTIGRGEVTRYQVQDSSEKIICYLPCIVMQFSENYDEGSPIPGVQTANGIFMVQVQPTNSYGTYSLYTNYQVGFITRYYIRVITESTTGYGDISITGTEEVQPWECFDFLNNRGSYCSYLGLITEDEVQGVVDSNNNDNATFSAIVYWSSATESGKGYGFNTGVTDRQQLFGNE